MWNFAQSDRSDHAWLQMTIPIVDGHFNGKDSVSYIGSGRNACDSPLHWSGIMLRLDRQLLPYAHSGEALFHVISGSDVASSAIRSSHLTYIRDVARGAKHQVYLRVGKDGC